MTRPSYHLTPRSSPSSLRQMLSVGQILSGKIENLGSRGEGIFHSGNDQVFVSKVAPGDEVEVKIYASKGSRYFAELVRHIQFSEDHRQPRCQHFYECGGCDFQNISYEDQMNWKVRVSQHWVSRSPITRFTEKLK